MAKSTSYVSRFMEGFQVPEKALHEVLDETAEKYGQEQATIFYTHRMTYAELKMYSERFASALQGTGVAKGDRVAVMLPNCPHYVIAYYGIVRAGAIVVQVNPMYVEREIEYILDNAEADVMVVYEPLLPRVQAVSASKRLKKLIVVNFPSVQGTYDGARTIGFEAFVMAAPSATPSPVPINPAEDVAVFQYTGGTTGRSKGAMLTHRNLVANAYQVIFSLGDNIDGPKERILTVIPFFHVYAMTVCMNAGILGGSCMILLPRFDVQEVLEAIREHKPTMFPGVPTMYVAVNAHPKAKEYGVASIRICNSGSAPMPVELMKDFERNTGARILEGYGLSEASPVTHSNPVDGVRKPGSVGIPMPGTESRIVDLATGTIDLPPGEAGELIIRGPQVMKGYWKMEKETAETIRDGWLYTGDIAYVDEDGYLYIVDRKKDLIIAGGYNIYPREVEEVLYEHPAVLEAVVVGVPDEYRGETVKAFIVRKEGAAATEEDIIQYCRQKLAAYKVPRYVEFRDALPKTAVGKILRRVLAEEARKGK